MFMKKYRGILVWGALMFILQTKPGESHAPAFMKEWSQDKGYIRLTSATIEVKSEGLKNEKEMLGRILAERKIKIQDQGIPVKLELATVKPPPIKSRYEKEIKRQSYEILVRSEGIHIRSETSHGIFYGIQTLARMIDEKKGVECGEGRDWPDLAVRMIMLDPARQNENMEYYKHVISFCGRYKINAILIHLTDDQTSALFHEDYPELMHPQAWKREQIRDLVQFAKTHHIELIPEIESFGHARMFERRPDFMEILHQTKKDQGSEIEYGTGAKGYTNVLCPASDKTYEYLDKMYRRAAECFDSPYIHIGCDEVDMTECARCEKKFPGQSQSEWFLGHILRCQELVRKHGKVTALWGDMLLSHRDIVKGLSPEGVIVYDWHYNPDVSAESSAFFKERGFEIIGSPALVCSPHIILPDEHNYTNIRRFAEIARQNDLKGLSTTIWCPMRYMSDVLWPGIGYAAEQSWSGSRFDENTFYVNLARDFFGSQEGESFARAWKELSGIIWHRKEFNTGCWMDDKSLEEARKMALSQGSEIRESLIKLENIKKDFSKIRKGIEKNREAWNAIERSAAILSYTMKHLLEAPDVQNQGDKTRQMIQELDRECVEAIRWIEEDWDRNRYSDDPNKNGLYLPEQHLLYRFKEMHKYHKRLLGKGGAKI
jgi:hypothetical protein